MSAELTHFQRPRAVLCDNRLVADSNQLPVPVFICSISLGDDFPKVLCVRQIWRLLWKGERMKISKTANKRTAAFRSVSMAIKLIEKLWKIKGDDIKGDNCCRCSNTKPPTQIWRSWKRHQGSFRQLCTLISTIPKTEATRKTIRDAFCTITLSIPTRPSTRGRLHQIF